ncbi:MAG: VPLPA-CTERM sorting domain-containing protein [Pseudomonadota bacterium]|nr:VPLPA-CTERM sorting domain-containing protein [Pseudomonadota bacterium]
MFYWSKTMRNTFIAAVCAALLPVAAAAAPVDLSTWTANGNGIWNLAGDNNSVKQTQNNNPTVFINHNNSQGLALSGTIKVETTSDDDFIGFVLGYNNGDLTNGAADYLLIDWKQGNQTYHGCTGSAGLSISRVSGQLGDNSGAWCHDPANNVTELQRATTFGNTGWLDNTEYTFELIFTGTNVQVSVNGQKELDINGSFANGSFGFYNYSQANVRYAGLQEEIAPAVPLPASLPLMLAGFGGLAALRRKARK